MLAFSGDSLALITKSVTVTIPLLSLIVLEIQPLGKFILPMNLKQLYDRDYNFWLETTKRQLENREFDAVDLENLIEEIDDMGKSQKP